MGSGKLLFLLISLGIACYGAFILNSCRFLNGDKDENFFTVSFIDVGQGDASLIHGPNNNYVLIDAGNSETRIISALRKRSIEELSTVIITHPDLDHFGSISAIINEFKIKRFILPNDSGLSEDWQFCLRAIRSTPSIQEKLLFGDTLSLGDEAYLKILWPVRSSVYAGNSQSYLIKMVYGNSSILFAGDISQETEYELLNIGPGLKSSILKVAHHGSRTSSSLPFLAAVSPIWAVISCDSSVYGHPHAEVINGLNLVLGDSSFVLRTDRLGDLRCALHRDRVRFF